KIGFAGIALTLADVVVFLPIAFMGGIVGAFFREFGLTVAFATLFSLLVSFTVTPALASRWYRRGEKITVAGGSRLDEAYGRVLMWALARPGWILGWGTTGLVAVLLVAAPLLGFEFLPASDQGQISIVVERPPGSSLAATDATVRHIEKSLENIPEISNAMATVGEVIGGFGSIPQRGAQYAQINVRLSDLADPVTRRLGAARGDRDRRSRADAAVAADIRRALRDIEDARVTVSPVRTVANIGSALQIELTGQDLTALAAAASSVRDLAEGVPGVVRPDTSLRVGQPEVRVVVDRSAAAACDVPPALAGSLLRSAVAGSDAGTIVLGGRSTPIRVSLAPGDRRDPEALMAIPVGAVGGQTVQVGDIADLSFRSGPTAVERINGLRLVTVMADLGPGYALGNVAAEVGRRLDGALPDGVTYRFGGESGVMQENIPHFVLAVVLAIVLLYLVTAALFNSLLYPLIMMLTLPMALIGALAGLVLFGETLSLVSMIGVIMLIGLMGRNAILLIDYTNTLRARGLKRADALREAGIARLRPIAMTTLTTIFGMLPVAMRIGRASELRAPMAIVVIGGLLVSTVLTLVVIPVAYDVADRWASGRRGEREDK
ncbi:MAG: efflux RND transporter permease subunit, partial [Armatimonadetes bacterium]|nr:efflux RND transporter permease subunit [Armatimonadota bacterium]